MSVDRHVYVGPYLVVPHAIQRVNGPELVRCTANKTHAVERSMKYCPHCGSPVCVTKREDLKPASVDVYDIAGDSIVRRAASLGIALDERDVWLSNNTTRYGGMYVEDGAIVPTVDNHAKFTAEMEAFRAAVQFIINDIEEQYGVIATVHHGIIPYWS